MMAPNSRLQKLSVDDVIAFFAENFNVNELSKEREGGTDKTTMMDGTPMRMVCTLPPPGLEISEEYKRELEGRGDCMG